MNSQSKITCALVAALAFGCGVEDGPDDGQESEEVISPNGVSLNGVSLNGVSLNGTSLSGVTLQSSRLVGWKSGRYLSASEFATSIFNGTLSNGQTIKVRVDSVATGASPNTDTYMYGVSYQTSTGWSKLCGADTSGNAILAIAMPGTFNSGWGVAGGGSYTADASQFTFGCRGFALAKCVELGYKYWKALPSDSSKTLLNHTVACTRMLRADYCGDGASWTLNGTPINLYDGQGIQADSQLLWPFEAEWGPGGASCVSSTSTLRWKNMSATAPACIAAKKSLTCGVLTHFATSSTTLLMDEYNP